MHFYRIEPAAALFPLLFCKLSICINPVIYVFMNTQFRKVLLPER